MNGLAVRAGTSPLTTGVGKFAEHHFYLDDLSLSNSITVEHNTLGPGVIGHILRDRVIDKTTYAATDSWFHYDQVGSVMDVTDSSADDTQLYQDAWGNPLPDEFLNLELFRICKEAQVIASEWRWKWNHRWLHGSLGYLTPSAFAERMNQEKKPATREEKSTLNRFPTEPTERHHCNPNTLIRTGTVLWG